MDVKAYAKINLTLDITGNREDGYHNLDTIMQQISLCDNISIGFNESGKIKLSTNTTYIPVNRKNTVYKAVQLFYECTGIRDGIDIYIEKLIPSRAGLGGGSADAAAVLKALNSHYGAFVSEKKLISIAVQVGADVPFCIKGGTCRCRGIGELVTPVSPMPDCFLVICKPPMGMRTPDAYKRVDSHEPPVKMFTEAMISALESGSIQNTAKSLNNRFDDVLNLGQVKQIKRTMLKYGALGALMSGSGTAVYGIFTDIVAAEIAMEMLKDYGKVFPARPI